MVSKFDHLPKRFFDYKAFRNSYLQLLDMFPKTSDAFETKSANTLIWLVWFNLAVLKHVFGVEKFNNGVHIEYVSADVCRLVAPALTDTELCVAIVQMKSLLVETGVDPGHDYYMYHRNARIIRSCFESIWQLSEKNTTESDFMKKVPKWEDIRVDES